MPGAPKPIGVPCEDKIRQAIVQNKNAVSIRVINGDEVVKTIVLGHSRRRAVQFLETLSRLDSPWSSLDVLNKDKDVITVVKNDGEPGELEALGEGPQLSSSASSAIAQTAAIARVMGEVILRGQREVLTYRSREVDTVMGALGNVVKDLGGVVHAINQAHTEQMEAITDAAEHRAQLQNRDWVEQLTELMEAAPGLAPMVMPLIAALKNALVPTKPAAKPPASSPANGANGANGAAKPPAA